MDIQKVKTEALRSEFKVVIPFSMISERVEKWLTEKAKTVRLDGFRPGKAPLHLIRQRYEGSAKQDILDDLIRESTQKAVSENEIRLSTEPNYDFSQFKEGEDFSFSVTVEALPTVELKDFSTLSVEKLDVKISEKDIEETLQKTAKNYRKRTQTAEDYAAQKGDEVGVSLLVLSDGKKMSEFSTEYTRLRLGENDQRLPGLDDQLVGMKADTKKSFELTLPKEMKSPHAGKTVSVDAHVYHIATLTQLPLSEELAKEFRCDSVDALREQLKEMTIQETQRLADLYHKRHILDALSDQYQFEVPQGMLKNEFDMIWGQLQKELAQARAEGTLEEDDDRPEDELRKEYETIAARRVRLGFVIGEVSRLNGIHLTNEMIAQIIYQEAAKYPGHEDEAVKFFAKNPKMIERLTAPALEDLVVKFIFDKAQHKVVSVSPKELEEKIKTILPGFTGSEDASEEEKG